MGSMADGVGRPVYNCSMRTAIIDSEGRVALSNEFLKGADLAPGEAVEVTIVEGAIILRRPPDDSEAVYRDKFLLGLDETIADIEAGRSTFHASDEAFLASLRSRESSEGTPDADPR